MKKYLSLLLSLIIIFSVCAPVSSAFAADETNTEIPIIYIRGNGQSIVNAEGKEVVCDVADFTLGSDSEDEEETKNKVVEAAVNILLPFFAEGLLSDSWDNYGKAVYEEISPLFKEAILDGNGNAQYGTKLAPEHVATNNKATSTEKLSGYSFYTYGYHFDWRLSPYDLVDELHKYIEAVMKVTNKKQVSLTSRCLGGSLLNVYLEKYAKNGHIKNVMYCDTLSNGCTLISKGFSGQIEFDAKSIQRYEEELEYLDEMGYGTGLNITGIAGEIVEKSIDLFTQIGVLDKFADEIEELYGRLYQALIPALLKATGVASQPIYWTFVEEEDFDLALKVMFGEEGSDEWNANSGLINKILMYRENISSKHDEFLLEIKDKYNIHFGVIAKYGLMAAPITKGYDELSDTLVSLRQSSFGATCATIGSVLSDDEISQDSIDKGYISPDKQVDVSTCLFPETTWIVKNVHHDDFDKCCKALAEKFLKGDNVTVENSGYSRFRINDYKNNTVSDMTEDNCADIEFVSKPVKEPTTFTKVFSLLNFFVVIIDFISRLFKGEIKF